MYDRDSKSAWRVGQPEETAHLTDKRTGRTADTQCKLRKGGFDRQQETPEEGVGWHTQGRQTVQPDTQVDEQQKQTQVDEQYKQTHR